MSSTNPCLRTPQRGVFATLATALVATALVVAGVLISPTPATAAPVTTQLTTAATTQPPSPGTTSTTTTTTPPAPSAAELERTRLAVALNLAITSAQSKLDAAASAYQTASTKVTIAEAAAKLATDQLHATDASYARLRHTATHVVVNIYISGAHTSQAADALFPNHTNQATTSIYDQIATTKIKHTLDALGRLERTRQAAVTRTNQALADARRDDKAAKSALAKSRAASTALHDALSTVDGGTLSLASDLSAAAAAKISRLVASGDFGIRAGVDHPPAPLPTTAAALDYATAQIGKPYVWGATGPDTFDCSGLMLATWSSVGTVLPRVAVDQYAATIPISFADLQPGDLVFFESPIGHVGIYIGNGLMIDAPYTGAFVRVDSIFWTNLRGFGRVPG